MWSMSLHKTLPSPKSPGLQDIAFMILLGPPHGECGSREVWEITTLILFKTDGLINTGGILTGSRPLQWECTGELDCQGPLLCSPHCEKTTSQGFSPSPGVAE